MLRRVALSLLMLMVLGVAAIVAAGHFGIPLPWHKVAVKHQQSPSDSNQAKAPESKDAAKTAEKTVGETTAALGGGTDASAPASGSVAIDISRISPDGTSVFAGRAEPDTYVTVMEDGKPAGTVKADEYGEWSLSTEHKFASADPKLTYEVSRTPPPAPEPPKVAKAEAAPSSAAGEVMRKFENLVEDAREEAKKNEEAKKAEETKKAELPAATAPSPGETVTAVEPDVVESDVEPAPQKDATSQSATSTGTGTSASSEKDAAASATVTLVPPSKSSETAGVKTDVIPVPIMFVYNEAKLTPEGERAAALLLEYLNLKHFSVVELTGHADERGTDDYNYDLSRERLDTVSQLLKEGGFRGELTLTPKGKSEPYMGVDRSAYAGEALFQLDRRVVLRVTR
jgi:outer membrane protein OmpA-like peptidoglycan-associated protein